MHRTSLNAVIDFIAFTCFVFLTSSGIIMYFLLPPRSSQGMSIWGLDRHDWGEIHFWIAVIMFAVLAFHLFLHWRWIVSVIKGQRSEHSGIRMFLGIVGLATILILAIAPLVSTTDESPKGDGGIHREDISPGQGHRGPAYNRLE